MKFTKEMFDNSSDDGVSIGEIDRQKDHVEVLVGVVDSTSGEKKTPILALEDVDFVEVDNNWSLDYFDGGPDPWIKVSKWVDFVDPDGDPHHGRLSRCWNPDKPTDIDYILEVDILSEP